MGDIIAVGIILLIVTLIIIYIVKQKKKGVKCIGCPHSKGSDSCGCSTPKKQKKVNK